MTETANSIQNLSDFQRFIKNLVKEHGSNSIARKVFNLFLSTQFQFPATQKNRYEAFLCTLHNAYPKTCPSGISEEHLYMHAF